MSYTAIIHHLTGTTRYEGYSSLLAAVNEVFVQAYDTYQAEIVKSKGWAYGEPQDYETVITIKQFEGLLKKIEQSKKKLIREMVAK